MLVSVITPCYNAGKYISQTIESVISQTFKDWEMLIIDDCSTDDSEAIIKKYCLKDSRIKYFRTDSNSGSPALPRNLGIEHAQGKYISFLDSDDIWFPRKLEEQLNFLIKKNYQIVYSDGNMIDMDGKSVKIMNKLSTVDYTTTLYRCELSCSSVLLTKSIIGSLRFEQTAKEDLVFWLKLLKERKITAHNTQHIHYCYRLLPNSRSRNKKSIVISQWYIYRKIEKLNVILSLYYMNRYIISSFKKYF